MLLLTLLTLPASAAPVDPQAVARVFYLDETGRRNEAAQEARALIEADPEDLQAHVAYLWVHRGDGRRAAEVLEATYAGWLAARPAEPARRAEMALVTAMVADGGKGRGLFPSSPGPWCDPVLALLDPLPDAPEPRARVAGLRQQALALCGRDDAATRAELAALAAISPRASLQVIRFAFGAGTVDGALAAMIEALLAAQLWRIGECTPLWGEDITGDGLARARASVLALATSAVVADDPVLVSGALQVLLAARATEPARVAAARLKEIDPERRWIPEPLRDLPAPRVVAPATIGDPVAALAALDDRRKDLESRYDRLLWWVARAEALEQLGRADAALRARRFAYWFDPGVRGNLRFAEAAVSQGRLLRPALHAADIAVATNRRQYPPRWRWEDSPEAAQALAEALTMRARVHHARGTEWRAADDAAEALLLEDSPRTRTLLGVALAADGEDGPAFVQLTRALGAGGSGIPALDREAYDALARLWPTAGWWSPGGLDGWIAAWRPPAQAAPAPIEARLFPDLPLTVDGKPTTLYALSGPLIIDVWATWCGPCVTTLPEFDAVALRYPAVTFVAISVDSDIADATRFLANSHPTFVAAWAGAEAMKTMGVTAIPATFVLDGDHRVLDSAVGSSPGSGRLEEMAERITGAGP